MSCIYQTKGPISLAIQSLLFICIVSVHTSLFGSCNNCLNITLNLLRSINQKVININKNISTYGKCNCCRTITGPTVIRQPGSYCLSADSSGPIIVEASHVKLDLNGFTLCTGEISNTYRQQLPYDQAAVVLQPYYTDFTLQNGTIKDLDLLVSKENPGQLISTCGFSSQLGTGDITIKNIDFIRETYNIDKLSRAIAFYGSDDSPKNLIRNLTISRVTITNWTVALKAIGLRKATLDTLYMERIHTGILFINSSEIALDNCFRKEDFSQIAQRKRKSRQAATKQQRPPAEIGDGPTTIVTGKSQTHTYNNITSESPVGFIFAGGNQDDPVKDICLQDSSIISAHPLTAQYVENIDINSNLIRSENIFLAKCGECHGPFNIPLDPDKPTSIANFWKFSMRNTSISVHSESETKLPKSPNTKTVTWKPTALTLQNGKNLELTDVTIEGFYNGTQVSTILEATLTEIKSTGSSEQPGKGIQVIQSENIRLASPALRNFKEGIYIDNSSDIIVTQGSMDECDMGLFAQDPENLLIEKLAVTNCSTGILLHNPSSALIQDNKLSGFMRSASLKKAKHKRPLYESVKGNFKELTPDGIAIYVASGENIEITHNNINDSNLAGIVVDGSFQTRATFNDINNIGNGGLRRKQSKKATTILSADEAAGIVLTKDTEATILLGNAISNIEGGFAYGVIDHANDTVEKNSLYTNIRSNTPDGTAAGTLALLSNETNGSRKSLNYKNIAGLAFAVETEGTELPAPNIIQSWADKTAGFGPYVSNKVVGVATPSQPNDNLET